MSDTRYVALEDVTLHKKESEEDNPNGKGKVWLHKSVTLVPGESLGSDELSDKLVELYQQGKLDHLIMEVPEDVAIQLGRQVAAGEDVNVKTLREQLGDVVKAKGEKRADKSTSEAA